MGAGDSRPLFSSEIWTKIADTAPLPPLPSLFDPLLLPSADTRFTCPSLPSTEFAQQLRNAALQLVYSNGSSGNWHAFIKRALSCFEQLHLQQTPASLCRAMNALLLLRLVAHSLADSTSQPSVSRDGFEQLYGSSCIAGRSTLLHQLIVHVVRIITTPVTHATYMLVAEAQSLLLSLLLPSVHGAAAGGGSGIHSHVHAALLSPDVPHVTIVRCLLVTFSRQIDLGVYSMPMDMQDKTLFPLKSMDGLMLQGRRPTIIADISGRLLLLLLHIQQQQQQQPYPNPFVFALQHLRSHVPVEPEAPKSSGRSSAAAAGDKASSVEFQRLFVSLGCAMVHDDACLLLLYCLLRSSRRFSDFVVTRTDIDALVLPLLFSVYCDARDIEHLHMAIVTLLILSNDAAVCDALHRIKIKEVLWFKERRLMDISVGSLVAVVLCRTVQRHFKSKEVYLHTNCIAVLYNVCAACRDVDAYAAQRIMNLLEMLVRRHNLLLKKSQEALAAEAAPATEVMDPTISADFVRLGLEVIHNILACSLASNAHMVYVLLHDLQVVQSAAECDVTCADTGRLLGDVAVQLLARLSACGSKSSCTPQVYMAQICDVLHTMATVLTLGDTRFAYEEDSNSVTFFAP